MSQTYEVGVRLSADGSGLVAQSKAGAESLDKVTESSRKLTDASRAAREEAMKAKEADAARRFESSELKKQLDETTRSQVNATAESEKFVQRLREQADTFGRSRQQIEQYRAAQLNLNAGQRSSADASLAAIAAQERQAAAMANLNRLTVTGALAAVAFATNYALGLKAVIDQADGFNKLSQSLAVSTEFLSAYTYQGKLSGVTQQEMATSMRQLARNVQETASDTGNGAKLFKALGDEVYQAAKRGESLEQLLPKISDAFARFADSPAKTALAVELFGRSGERMIPMLNGGSQAMREAAAEAEAFRQVIGPEMARRAEAFNDNLSRMNALFSATKFAIVDGSLPWLNKMLEQMVEGTKIAGGFGHALANFGRMSPFKSPAESIATAKDDIEELQYRRSRLSKANASPSALIGIDMEISDAQERLKFSQFLQRQEALGRVERWDTSDQNSRTMNRKPALAYGAKDPKPAKAVPFNAPETLDFDRLYKQTTEQLALAEAQRDGTGKLTSAEQLRVKVLADLEAGLIDLGPVEERVLLARLDEAAATQRQNAEYERLVKAQEQVDAANRKALATVDDQNKKLAEHIEQIGLTNEQLAVLKIQRAETALAVAEEAEQTAVLSETYEGNIELLKARTRAAREFLELTKQGASRDAWAEQNRKMGEDFRRTSDNIERALTDSILRGFDKGKTFMQNFKDALVNGFKTAILQPIIAPIVRPVAQAIGGLVSGFTSSLGFASGGGGAGGAGSALSMASGANTVSGWFGGPSLGPGSLSQFWTGGIAGMGAATGGATLSTMSGAALADISLGGLGGSAAAAELAAGAGGIGSALAAIPGWGWALGAGALLLGSDLFGGGGGPKASEAWLQGGPGSFNVGMNNVAGGDPDMAQVRALNAMLQDPTKYDQGVLASLAGTNINTGAPADTGTLIAKLTAALQPAADAAQAATTKAAETAAKTAAMIAQQRQLDIALMEAQGNAAGALAAKRDDELAAMDESLRATARQIYAQQDLAQARQDEASKVVTLANTLQAAASTGQSLQSAVAGLPNALGINTLLDAQRALATSDYNAPLDRLAAARAISNTTYASAIGGDLSAVQSYAEQAQSVISIARDLYASGPQFQEVFREENRKLGDLLTRQQTLQTDILKDVPMTIQQAANDQISQLKMTTRALVEELQGIKAEIRMLASA